MARNKIPSRKIRQAQSDMARAKLGLPNKPVRTLTKIQQSHKKQRLLKFKASHTRMYKCWNN